MNAWLNKYQCRLGIMVYWNVFFFVFDVINGVRLLFVAFSNPWYFCWVAVMFALGGLMFWAARRSLHYYWNRAETKRINAETAAIMQRVHGEWP